MPSSTLAHVSLPEFGLPTIEPTITGDTYHVRLDKLYSIASKQGYDYYLVYADREHSANLSYLTGFDPRFEEALLICDISAGRSRKPQLLVGNEGHGFTKISPIVSDLNVILFQSFSLPGQDRSHSKSLQTIFTEAGIKSESRVGVAGWKPFIADDTDTPNLWLEIPSYIVDILRDLTGSIEYVVNANDILMDASDGLRVQNEVDQLARFEFVSTYSSQAVRNVLFGVKPGMTEFEAVQLMQLNGLPLSCHLMLSSGERAFIGMGSPTSRVIQHGDPFTNAVGLWGSLNSRAGFIVSQADELPEAIQDYVDKLVAPYFEAIVAWYETIGIGVTGGELYRVIHDRIGDPFYGVELNPGHLIHLDEWLNSPVYEGSIQTLQSGMAIQVDVIPATGTDYFMTNIEDGIALADEELRAELAEKYPEAWSRIQARRTFMIETIGINLKPEVLPFSNIPAYLPPYLLNPMLVMTMDK